MRATPKPLDQQVVVITGASSGIGLATALRATAAGAKVVLTARNGCELDELVERVRANHDEAVCVAADLTNRARVEWVARAAIARFGRIDTWVNHAGVAIHGGPGEVDAHDSRRRFDIHFWGVVYGSLVAIPHLQRSGGSLINVGGEPSESAVALCGLDSANEHAVRGFTDALRAETEQARDPRVSITLVQPTALDSRCTEHSRVDAPALPTPRIDPDRVARAILRAATRRAGATGRVGARARFAALFSRWVPLRADLRVAQHALWNRRSVHALGRVGNVPAPSAADRIPAREFARVPARTETRPGPR